MKNITIKKSSLFKTSGSIIRWVVIIPVMFVIIYPLLSMVVTSLLDQYQVLDPSVIWVPKTPKLDNYEIAFEVLDYGQALLRTITVCIISALVEVGTCAVTAYGFARFKFKFQNLFLGLLILSIIVPQEMVAIPTYLQLRYADILGILEGIGKIIGTDIRPNLLNTTWSFWIPALLSVGIRAGLFIFIYMQFFKGLPKELEEAAYIDGAGPLKTFLRIIIPSSGVAILTVSIFSVIWYWNDYYLSSLYFSENFTLAVRISQIETLISTYGTNSVTSVNGIKMASSILFILPMLLMYMILQKKFVESVDRVGIVG